MSRYEDKLLEYFDNVSRYMRIQPTILGGYASSEGGSGGAPPGGFVGYLPQARVSYDTTEAAISGVPASGMSLVDNLNKIRYRITVLESEDHIYNEMLDSQVTGSGNHYTLSGEAIPDTVRLYHNGIRKAPTYFVVDGNNLGFTTTFIAEVGDSILVDYDVLVS